LSRAGDVWLLDHAEIQGGGQRFGLRLVEAMREAGLNAAIAYQLTFPTPAPWNPAALPAVRRTRRFLSGLDPAATVIGNHPRVHAYLYAASPRSGGPAIVNIAHERDSASRSIARFAYRRFGSLVAVGANAAREYESRLPGVQVTQINNFLPVSCFERARGERVISPHVDDLSIGVLARLIPEKGIVELIEELAFPEIRPAWRKLVVGGERQDAAYANRVERRSEELGLSDRVSLIGETGDVPGFLGSVDVLLVPSIGKEAQPTTIIEALAHGVPVIVREPLYSSDFEGLPISSYGTPVELGKALRARRPSQASVEELIRRFGPAQAIAGIDTAAQLARARS
jgi:glycosyltransferase involved in cell wall biosynthesis